MARRYRRRPAPLPRYDAPAVAVKAGKRVIGNAPELMALLPEMSDHAQTWHTFTAPERAVEMLEAKTAADYWHQNSDADSSFYGETRARAREMVRQGWQEGAERVARIRDRINAANPQGPRLVRHDVAGAYPVVARAVAGNPLNMRRIDSARLRRRPVVTLINNMGGNCTVDAAAFVNRCAVVAAIIDAIEAAGFSCHVIGICIARKAVNNYLSGQVYQLKQPGEHIDLARLAFALGHVAMFRRVGFDVWGTESADSALGMNLGHSIDLPAESPADDVYVLPCMNDCDSKFMTEDKAATEGLQYFIAKLAAQGCPAFPQTEGAAA